MFRMKSGYCSYRQQTTDCRGQIIGNVIAGACTVVVEEEEEVECHQLK